MGQQEKELRELRVQLELSNRIGHRRWRFNLAALLVLTMAFVLGATTYKAAPTFDVLRARQLTIVDDAGKVRALLRVGKDESVALAFLDKEGWTRASLALLPNGTPRLRLYEKLQQARAGLDIGADGAGATALATTDGTLYFHSVGRIARELPTLEGVRLRKATTVSELEKAAQPAYQMVDAERLPDH